MRQLLLDIKIRVDGKAKLKRNLKVTHTHRVLLPVVSLCAEVNGKLQLLTQYGISICSTSHFYLTLSKVKLHHINDATF